jgi:hypothetical protein
MTTDWNDPNRRNGAPSRAGQLIGDAFERVVIDHIRGYLNHKYPEYVILSTKKGKELVTLPMLGGASKQMDTVLALRNSDDPVALLESKWLKDGRHHNDKGAWILQLREVKKRHPTIRGAAAILAGYWTEGVGVMLMAEGGIDMVWVATDDEVYQPLQPYLDQYYGDNTFRLNASEMRGSYTRPGDFANFLEHLASASILSQIAQTWLNFPRETGQAGTTLIEQALDKLLAPLPSNPQIQAFEISLQVSTGNMIHGVFDDVEAALEFIQQHMQNPEHILRKITPKVDTPSDDETNP